MSGSRREVESLRSLAGEPYVVAVHSAGVTPQDRAFVVTDYCPAGSLYDHLTTVGRFTPAEVRRIGVKLASALAGAHDRDIFHRNVKPANVLIDPSGEPALTDFGIVALATSNGDYTPPVPSTQRAYVAPEAFLPELMSAAADVYALGATLYALLAGWAPRTAGSARHRRRRRDAGRPAQGALGTDVRPAPGHGPRPARPVPARPRPRRSPRHRRLKPPRRS